STTRTGKIVKLGEDGWKPVASPAAHVLDIAMNKKGRAVAVAYPEEVFASADEGTSWSRVDAPMIGATYAGVNDAGELMVEGYFDALAITPGQTPAFASRKDKVPRGLAIETTASRQPHASDIGVAGAAIDGDRYYLADQSEGGEW